MFSFERLGWLWLLTENQSKAYEAGEAGTAHLSLCAVPRTNARQRIPGTGSLADSQGGLERLATR